MTSRLVWVKSYGVRYRPPIAAQFTVDARILDNPDRVEELKPYNGLYPDVAEYVLVQPIAGELLTGATIIGLTHIDAVVARNDLTVVLAVFCTDGKHRSVAVAEELARRIRRQRDVQVRTDHLDITTGREQWPFPVEPPVPDLTGDDQLSDARQPDGPRDDPSPHRGADLDAGPRHPGQILGQEVISVRSDKGEVDW